MINQSKLCSSLLLIELTHKAKQVGKFLYEFSPASFLTQLVQYPNCVVPDGLKIKTLATHVRIFSSILKQVIFFRRLFKTSKSLLIFLLQIEWLRKK